MALDLPPEFLTLPALHARLEERVRVLEDDMREIKADLKDFRTETDASLKTVTASLNNVVVNALNSMPQWGAQALRSSSLTTGALGGIVAVLVMILLYMLRHHS